MCTEIADSLSENMVSTQLTLTDFGFKEPKMRVIDRTLGYPEDTSINVKLQNIDDNHFEYVNPVCPHCFEANRRDHVVKRGFRDRKIRIDDVEKINPYSNDEDTVFKDTVKHLIVSDVKIL